MENNYNEPVSKLIKLGRSQGEEWEDYLALGLTREHIPALIQLMQDESLKDIEPPEDLPEDGDLPEWYARIHAWRALGQLKAESAIPAILGILHEIDDEENDWLTTDAEKIFSFIGVVAIAPLAEYLTNAENGIYARWEVSSCLVTIAKEYPDTRNECLSFMVAVLEKYKENDETLNGALINDLVELKAVEYIDLIEAAFDANKVDEFIGGDFEDVQVDLGLRERRSTPRKRESLFQDAEKGVFIPQIKSIEQKKKEKDKRKQEKKSRKKNRKKK